MKRTLLSLLAGATLAAGAPAIASAQGWMGYDQRQVQLDQRIEAGIRNGRLTATEANRLRDEFDDIVRLESRYRWGGFTASEQADLNRRYDDLANRIRIERRDGQQADRRGGRWENLNQRQAEFRQRLDQAVRDRRLTQRQADDLRREFDTVANIERDYRRGGLTVQERADLDMRMDRLQSNFRAQVSANQYGYGYGQSPNLFDWLFGIR